MGELVALLAHVAALGLADLCVGPVARVGPRRTRIATAAPAPTATDRRAADGEDLAGGARVLGGVGDRGHDLVGTRAPGSVALTPQVPPGRHGRGQGLPADGDVHRRPGLLGGRPVGPGRGVVGRSAWRRRRWSRPARSRPPSRTWFAVPVLCGGVVDGGHHEVRRLGQDGRVDAPGAGGAGRRGQRLAAHGDGHRRCYPARRWCPRSSGWCPSWPPSRRRRWSRPVP